MSALTFPHVFQRGSDGSAAPLLLLHGTGGTEHDLISLGQSLSPGAALLSPRGKVNEQGALRFFARLSEGRFDPVEVNRRAQELADFVDAAVVHYGLPPGRLQAVGFSNGANIAAALLQLRPATLGGAVLIRPMVVLDQPAAADTLVGKRVLLLNGAQDPLVPPDHPERLARLLRAGGATVKVEILPGSHALTRQDVALAKAWFE